MIPQSQKFLTGTADDYYHRNKADLGKTDPVMPLIERIGLRPGKVLEVGCANGWRLERLQAKYGCEVSGIEPSRAAVVDAERQAAIDDVGHRRIIQGTADDLGYWDSLSFDTVIIGFCMFLIEPWQWLRVAAEVDRVLMNGGALIVHDFTMPYPTRWEGWCELYGGEREKDTVAWLYDFPKLWLGHPCYRYVTKEVFAKRIGELFILEAATLLRKSFDGFIGLKPEEAILSEGVGGTK